ncbi:hypothetical protein [Pseudobacteroides cellulosolvens]|uniref:Uncharacterized protein n=1 Tax=Pseudobacteroides cellulosolvens ATCC 35603 = DSM 2933 TaxID=398512 RepID=A0A0L6JJ80_9FIRM|nr:hypothetical protein [Pseudobacteroides cellulosolvens]KNY25790.1 hypothetical protein Bccel_1050 [Pseudobacteroides cellulosolvens ATCC 35603 = DSM 2933]
MIISKLTKAFILGSCITVLSSTAAFAQTGGEVSQGVSSVQQSDIESPLFKKTNRNR